MKEKREYKECYVAIIDLLGFKNSIMHKNCEEIAQYYDEIHQKVTVTVNTTRKALVPSEKIHMKVMSDTVCFFVECSETNSLAGLLAFCSYFQVRMLQLPTPVLSRGAVVKGKLYCEDDVFFGEGIVNAYLLEENVAKYPRVIMTKEVIDGAITNCDENGKYYLETHTFEDTDLFYCVDSLLLFYGVYHEKNEWKTFARYVKKVIESETNPSIREKYIYIYKKFPRISKRHIELIAEE